MKKEDLLLLNGRVLSVKIEQKVREGKLTREQATKLYAYWNTHNAGISALGGR